MSNKRSFIYKRVLVMGFAKSGLAACRLLHGLGAQVTLFDQKPRSAFRDQIRHLPADVVLKLGPSRLSSYAFDLIVVSPGIPWNHPSLRVARQKNIPVWPELELGWRMVRPRHTVAVTGTNGKTTTTALIGHILQRARRSVIVGGNIGTPLSALVRKITKQTILVLEVSSYQLEAHETFHPDVALFLNVTPDHLARHKTIRNYALAKARLLKEMNGNDVVVYNRNDVWCRFIVKRTRAVRRPFPTPDLFRLASHTILRGQHNIENAMAAAAACQALGLSATDIIDGIKSFRGVPHRIQVVGKRRGVLYVNDSKGTNVDSTLVALKAFPEPTILLLGGEHKGSSYKPLIPQIRQHVKEVIAYGEARNIIYRDLKGTTRLTLKNNLEQALSRASATAASGDVVLLSPACASFDQYRNYEERGEHFMSLVKRISP